MEIMNHMSYLYSKTQIVSMVICVRYMGFYSCYKCRVIFYVLTCILDIYAYSNQIRLLSPPNKHACTIREKATTEYPTIKSFTVPCSLRHAMSSR